jgi:hypothetical protein
MQGHQPERRTFFCDPGWTFRMSVTRARPVRATGRARNSSVRTVIASKCSSSIVHLCVPKMNDTAGAMISRIIAWRAWRHALARGHALADARKLRIRASARRCEVVAVWRALGHCGIAPTAVRAIWARVTGPTIARVGTSASGATRAASRTRAASGARASRRTTAARAARASR